MDPTVRVKREPLAMESSSTNVILATNATSAWSSTPIKAERASDKEEEEPLPMPDPDKPKNYKRIRQRDDTDEEDETDKGDKRNKKGKTGGAKNGKRKKKTSESDGDEDVYVPLVDGDQEDGSHSATESEDSQNNRGKSNKKRRILTRNTRKKLLENKSQSAKSNGNKTSRRKSSRKRNNSSSSEDLDLDLVESSSETQSLDGFIVDDSAAESDPEEIDDGNEAGRKPKTRKSSLKTTSNSRRADSPKPSTSRQALEQSNNSDASGSSDSLFERVPKSKGKVKTNAKKKNNPRRSNSQSDTDSSIEELPQQKKKVHFAKTTKKSSQRPKSSSGSSDSEENSASDSPEELGHDVATELKSFGVGDLKPRKRRRRRMSSGDAKSSRDFLQNPPEFQERHDSDSNDSFIDNQTKNYGNLESSSESDEEVVQEEEGVLDLNSDNFESGTSESEVSSDDEGSDRSQSDSDGGGRRRRPSDEIVENKCALCDQLGGNDFRHRDNYPQAKKWCSCGRCKVISPKMKNYDRICCRELSRFDDFTKEIPKDVRPDCITKHPSFKKSVLECHAYIRSIKKRVKGSKNEKDKAGKAVRQEFKKATDKEKVLKCKISFIRWLFGRNDLDQRMVVPICVLQEIRKKYVPSAGPLYFDCFKPKRTCLYNYHCNNAFHDI